MKIARPPGGFKISLSPGAQALIGHHCSQSEAFRQHWTDIVDKLRFVAHVEGVADSRFANGCRLWASAADEERDLPRIKLIYLVLGDRVTIKVVSIG